MFFDRKLTFIDRVSQLSTGGQHARIKDFLSGGGGGGGSPLPTPRKQPGQRFCFYTT